MLSESSLFEEFLEQQNAGFQVSIPLSHPSLNDHIVRGQQVLPGVVYLDLAIAAVRLRMPDFQATAFEDCVWIRPFVGHSDPVRFRIVLESETNTRIRFEMLDDSQSYAHGWIVSKPAISDIWSAGERIWNRVTENSVQRFSRRRIYEEFSKMGIDYGTFFRRICYADIHENQSVALLSNNDGTQISFSNMLDCAFQSGMAISIGTERGSLMPFSLGALIVHEPIQFVNSHSFVVVTEKSTQFRTNITIFSDEGTPLVSVFDLGVKPSRL